MENKKVNILGTEYKMKFNHKAEDSDGESYFYKKRIEIKPIKRMLDKLASKKDKRERQKEVIRHELFHCYFHELVNDNYAYDENLVDTLAILSPRIFKQFQELDIL